MDGHHPSAGPGRDAMLKSKGASFRSCSRETRVLIHVKYAVRPSALPEGQPCVKIHAFDRVCKNMCPHLCEIRGATKGPDATMTTSLIPKDISTWCSKGVLPGGQKKKTKNCGAVSLSDQWAGMGERMGDKHQGSTPRWVERGKDRHQVPVWACSWC